MVARVSLLTALACAYAAAQAELPKRWNFATHISPILTFGGCNQTACHGSPVGKNGFKLSLYASEPAKDYETLVKAVPGRRVNTQSPGESLLLKKPTMQVAHGGGPRFKQDSRHYAILKAWIEAGAPFGDKDGPELVRLEVTPGYRVLKTKGETVALKVMAIYSDKSAEDVTALSVYSSNDEAVLKVSPSGKITAEGATGDAAIMVRYAGKFAAPVFGATMYAVRPSSRAPEHPIDREVYAKLRQLHIAPSPICSDEEFVRRAYLDIGGTLPSTAETRLFVSSAAPGKRELLIDQLLERPEHADVQTMLWADRLRSDSRFHRVGGVRSYYRWLREEFAANRPLDKIAHALLTARGPNFTNGAANYWGNYDKISTPIETAIQTGQVMMGVRIGCAQCHNHPFEKWSQNDFYSLAAVFSQVVELNTKNAQEFDLRLDPNRAVINPATKQAAEPRFLGGDVINTAPGEDRRVAFAQWLTNKDNPYFARTMANYTWRQMMGRGIVNPVDDFRETNPPTHPELLDLLAKELASHDFDVKHLIRFIASSRTYQHSSSANETNRLDFKYYSRAYPKRMLAEVYMDAIAQVTRVPDSFKDWPEAKRAMQLPDNRYPSFFLDVFERSNRLVICDREENVTVPQALHFVNGPEVQSKLAHPDSRLSEWLRSGRSDSEMLDDLFLATYSRRATPREKDRLLTRIGNKSADRTEIWQDIFWAVLNSEEFIFNH